MRKLMPRLSSSFRNNRRGHFNYNRLRKVKMDQRKLMDNANTITDMAKTQNTVYEIVSDMSSRQDALEERISSLEDKIQTVQVHNSLILNAFKFTQPV